MTETQHLVWVLSSPVCAEVNNALQELTGVSYTSSDHHKDFTHSRQLSIVFSDFITNQTGRENNLRSPIISPTVPSLKLPIS